MTSNGLFHNYRRDLQNICDGQGHELIRGLVREETINGVKYMIGFCRINEKRGNENKLP